MFYLNKHGIQVENPQNNIVVSIQMGEGTYSDRQKVHGRTMASTVELALFEQTNGDRIWRTKEFAKDRFNIELGDDVMGYVDSNIVVAALVWATTQ